MKKYLIVVFCLLSIINSKAIPLPNLIITGTVVSPITMYRNQTYTVSCTVKNIGAATTTSGFYTNVSLNTVATYNGSQTYLTDIYFPCCIAPGASATYSATITIPCTYSTGTRYILFAADATNMVAESNETDNGWPGQSIVLTSAVDLAPVSGAYSLSTGLINAGNSLNANFAVDNIGGSSASSFNVGFYLSPTSTLVVGSAGTVFLGSYSVSSLAACSNTTALNKSLLIPSSTCTGNYYLFMFIDNGLVISEYDETNNFQYQPIFVNGVSAPSAPASLTASTLSSGSIQLTWPSSPGATSYNVYYSSSLCLGNTTVQASPTSSPFSITGLSPSTPYFININAVNSCGSSGYSPCASATTFGSCTAVSISSNPSNQTVTSGSAASFTAGASGTPPYNYFWYTNGVFATSTTGSFSTSNTYTTPALGTSSSGSSYYCIVTNCSSSYSATTSTAYVTVTSGCTPVSIASNPSSLTISSGNTASFTVSANGTGPYNYFWYTNGALTTSTIGSFATSNTYTTPSLTTFSSGNSYYCIVTNCSSSYASTSSTAYVTVTSGCTPVSITTNPSPATAAAGTTASFSIATAGTGPITYQWYKLGTLIPGATNSSYTTPTLTLGDNGNTYYCVVNNCTGSSATSSSALLTVTSSATLSVISSVIPPWQRQGDDFGFSVRVNTTPTGALWHIRAKVYFANNTLDQIVDFPGTTAISDTENTFWAVPSQCSVLKSRCLEGEYVKYEAVLNSTGVAIPITGQTNINEKKWAHKNVYLNKDPAYQLTIPIKYDPLNPATYIKIERDGDVSFRLLHRGLISPSENITNTIYLLSVFDIGSDGKSLVTQGNSNISTLLPGDFKVTTYSYATPIDSQYFDLTKYGRVINAPNHNTKIVIHIGGIFNEIENNIDDIRGDYPSATMASSSKGFSIAAYLEYNHFNTWFIAQGNANSIARNGYDIGKAIEKIISDLNSAGVTPSEIDFVCHSKGGVDMRSFLEDYTISYDNTPSAGLSTAPWRSLVKKVVFLGTPHFGANIANWVSGSGIQTSPGVLDLRERVSVNLNAINSIVLPSSIEFCNLTAYKSSYQDQIYLTSVTNQDNDGVVNIKSSDGIYMPVGIQLFQNCNGIFIHPPHLDEHQNDFLSSQDVHYDGFNCTTPTFPNNLQKILGFLNGATIATCTEPRMGTFTMNHAGSVLSGAYVSIKRVFDSTYYIAGQTDENGSFRGTLIPALTIGDSFLISAPGYEPLILAVDSDVLLTGTMEIGMLKSIVSNRIQYPSLELLNNNRVTSSDSMKIRAKAKNALSFQINSPLNQDSIFVPLLLSSDSTFYAILDTGYNNIVVRIIGPVDTVVLTKTVVYLPDSMINQYAYSLNINTDSNSLHAKLYVNNIFIKELVSSNDTIPVLTGENGVKFTKFGYVDTAISVDSSCSINVSLQLIPHSYSSPTDSNIIDFTTGRKIQYRKNVTVMDTALLSIISLKQYDDSAGFAARALIPKSRKFEMRLLNTGRSQIRCVAVLDQIEDLSPDSVYLLIVYNDSSFVKVAFDTTGNGAGFDSIVQKLTLNYVNFDSGTKSKESIVILKKQAPIVNTVSTISINENDSLVVPLTMLFSDPDSIRNDMTYSLLSSTPAGLNLSITGGNLIIHTNPCYSGSTSIHINATHDWLVRSNVINVIVVPNTNPVITATGPTTICSGDTVVLHASVGLGYQWLLNHLPISGATNSAFAATATGYYSTIVTRGVCHDTSNEIHVIVNPAPSAITGTTNVCVASSATFSDATPLGAWISSNSAIVTVGSGSGVITGIAAGTATITYTLPTGCYVTQNVTVNSTTASILGASGVCVGLTTTLSGVPSGGAWASNPTSVAIVGSSSGILTGVAAGTVNITYLPTPTACFVTKTMTVNSTAGPITGVPGVCPGSTTTLVGPLPGGTWSSGSTSLATIGSSTGIVTGVSPGTTTITYLIGTGCTSTIPVSVHPLPSVIPVSGGGTMCVGWPGIIVSLPASAVGVNYQLMLAGLPVGAPVPGTGSSLSFGPQTSGGVYTVVATDALTLCRSTMSGSANITVFAAPTISAGSGVSICNGASTTLTASGGVTYTWSPSTGMSSTIGASVIASPATTVTYTVTGTNSLGCTNKATVTVTVNPLPTIIAVSGTAICSGASVALSASGGATYTWSPTAGLSSTTGASVTASPATTTTYTVTGTSSLGCSNRATVVTTVNLLPTISAGSGRSICNGGSVTLTASGGVTYTWSPSTGLSSTTGASIVASPTTTITYTVTGTNSNGCSNRATVTVTVNSLPAISAGSGVSICSGASTILNASGGLTYTWSPTTSLSSTTGASIIASPTTTTTTYTVTGTNSNGCSNRAAVTVTVNSLPVITAGSGVSICTGASATLSASGGVTYAWSPSTGLSSTTGASITANPTVTTNYTVTGTSSNGCINRATVTVSVNLLPTISAGPGVPICNGGSATLSASGGVTYIWSPGTGLSSTTGASVVASPTTTTIYTVTGTNSLGCTNRANVTVTVNPLPTISAGSGASICNGASTTLAASGGIAYTWSPVTGLSSTTGASVVASPTSTTTYTVSGTNSYGCSSRATKTVTVNASPAPISSISSICIGTAVSLTDAVSGGTWVSSNTSVATIGSATGVITGSAIGSTNISYTLTSGCRTTLMVSVVSAASAIVGPAAIYTGVATTYTNSTGGGVWSSSNTSIITIGSANGIATGFAAGNATITYSISTGCRSMITVTVTTSPIVDTVTGGGVYCTGGTAPTIGLNNSQTGFSYRLYLGSSAVGSIVAGTGSAISFGTFTTAGTYTAKANASGLSPLAMAGSATVTVIPSTMLPAVVTVGGGGSFCAGSPGVPVTLPGSAVSVIYQLFRSGVLTGSPVAGTGTALSFGLQALPGIYTVVATSTVNGCSRTMLGSANATEYPVPNLYNVTGGGTYCSGSTPVTVGLNNSQTGINYQLYNGSSTVGSPLGGTGSTISFGSVTSSGVYSVVGTNTSTACHSTMTGTATVSVNPLPAISGSIYTVMPGATITLTGTPTGGMWTSGTTSVATIGSSTGIVTGVTLGSTLISYTLPTTCRITHSVAVTATGHREGPAVTPESAHFTEIFVMPNPNKGTFTIKGTLDAPYDIEVSYEVLDMLGKVVYKGKATASDGVLEETVRLRNVASGVYMLNVQTVSETKNIRIIVE